MTGNPILTDVLLRKMKAPKEDRTEHYDGRLPGFGVRVTKAGTKTFFLVYRYQGSFKRMSLGRYPVVSLHDARLKAQDALRAVTEGTDPQVEKRQRTIIARNSFEDVVTAFVEGHCKRYNRLSTAKETERLLRADFLPKWKSRSIRDISRQDVLQILDSIEKSGKMSAARHAFAAARKCFNWCVEKGLIDQSPCANLKTPGLPSSRDIVLNEDQLRAIIEATNTIGWPYGSIVQLLALTAQRRGEVVGMTWDEIDFDKCVWTIPGERTKNRRSHIVPLTGKSINILRTLPSLEESPYVFPARGKPDRTYSGYSKGKRMLDATCNQHGWTLHDLRRTAATGMAQAGVAPHVVERLLNHSTGTFGGVAGVYNRYGYLDEMRQALVLWEKTLEKLGCWAATDEPTAF